ncbi:hypothetical protein C8J56DRAFT_954809 [Mycena floridula]|nr:hypothetical protein C8J56DRAFT_954809 [Mycena floridula]
MPRRAAAVMEVEPEPEAPMEVEPTIEDRLEKEQEIWAAFKDEHHEVVDQMPLSLHRQFTLLRELDEQATSHKSNLLPLIHQYILLRQSIACGKIPEPIDALPQPPNGAGYFAFQSDTAPTTPARRLLAEALGTPRTPTPMGVPPERVKTPETTREMLSHMAWLSEEIMLIIEEQVNLAQAADDYVERNTRLVDQAIKEQEASIALGQRSGTHIALPELVLPHSARPQRPVATSPTELFAIEDFPIEDPLEAASKEAELTLGRGKRARNSRRDSRSLKITLPAPAATPDEKLYCVCQLGSFGEAINVFQFHLDCVGLQRAPENRRWYCPDCTIERNKPRNERRKR